MKRRLDTKNYPDFEQLETQMQELVESDKCPIDFNKLSISEIYDTLYNLARSQHSDKAIQQAEQLGRKSAEAALAKESQTTVAGGGKSGSITNPTEIKDIKKLREYFVAQLGEAE
jgi:hypothetical protein